MTKRLARLAILAACTASLSAAPASTASLAHISKACSTTEAGFVTANLSWGVECLHAGEFCKTENPEYHAYGFDCPGGRLEAYVQTAPATTTAPPPQPAVTTNLTTTLTSHACGGGYVSASLPWGHKCLRAGEFCKVHNVAYRRYGFTCPSSGHLKRL